MNTVLMLTEFQYNFLLALGGLILTGIGTLCVPVIKALWGQWKESRKEKNAKAEKNREESSEVEIAKIQDEAQTRSELWTEVRFLRKDYNVLSLAYAELQKQNAESRGEVKFMQLQMENVMKDLSKVQTELKDYEKLLFETRRNLEHKEVELAAMSKELTATQEALNAAIHDKTELEKRVHELETTVEQKKVLITEHETTIETLKKEITGLKGE